MLSESRKDSKMKLRSKIFKGIIRASALLCAGLMLAGCSSNIKPVKQTDEEKQIVGTVNGRQVFYDELRYITLNTKDELRAAYGDTIFDTPESAAKYADELREKVTKRLTSDYYALCAMADEYYPGGSEAMLGNSAIEEAVSKYVNETADECGGKKEYLAALKENYMNDRLFRFYTACEECSTELIYILKNDLRLIPCTEDEIKEAMNSGKLIRTNHVFIKDRTEESRATAETVLAALKASASPDLEIILLKGKYDRDFSMTTTHGKYFARYTSGYGDNYEKAAMALKVGGISEIVEGRDGSDENNPGYFVIIRLPLEDDWIAKNYESFAQDLILSEFNVMLDDFKTKLRFIPNEFFGSLDLTAVK